MRKVVLIAISISFLIIPQAIATPSEKPKPPKNNSKTWRADLSVIPSRNEIEKISLHVDKVMRRETDKQCTAISPRLRKMIFLHFALYQYMANKRSIYLQDINVQHWAHIFGIVLKESSGDATNVTSMTGKTYTTYQVKSNLARWRRLVKLAEKDNIPMNSQTNFGLTQISVDRLFIALKFPQEPAYLKGRHIHLNTASAIRRLIWFYQGFARGRLTQSQDIIHDSERRNPEYASRLEFGTSMALLLCGTNYMFYEGYGSASRSQADLVGAMASIAFCEIGDAKSGYGIKEEHQMCFAKWVTLCPTLNFDIAMITPLNYFATRSAKPLCEKTFQALLIKKPKLLQTKALPEIEHITKKIKQGHKKQHQSKFKKVMNRVSSLLKSLLVPSSKQPQ